MIHQLKSLFLLHIQTIDLVVFLVNMIWLKNRISQNPKKCFLMDGMWIVLMNIFADIFCQPSKISNFYCRASKLFCADFCKITTFKGATSDFCILFANSFNMLNIAFQAHFKLAWTSGKQASKI